MKTTVLLFLAVASLPSFAISKKKCDMIDSVACRIYYEGIHQSVFYGPRVWCPRYCYYIAKPGTPCEHPTNEALVPICGYPNKCDEEGMCVPIEGATTISLRDYLKNLRHNKKRTTTTTTTTTPTHDLLQSTNLIPTESTTNVQ